MDMFTVLALGLSAAEERELATFCKFASRKTHSWSLTSTLRQATGVLVWSTLPAQIAAAVAFQAAGGRVVLLSETGLHDKLTAVRKPLQLDRAFAVFNHFRTQQSHNARVPNEAAYLAFESAFPTASGQGLGAQGDQAKVLPLIRAPLVPEPQRDSRVTSQAFAGSVMVVDDSPVAQNYLRNRVLAMGLDCDVAASGDEALLLISQKNYAVVLLDIHMQGIDGYQTCRAIKSYKRNGFVSKVVMTSSKTGAIDKIRAALAGCDGYLTKPINEAELVRTLSTHVKKSLTVSSAGVSSAPTARPPFQSMS
jgi:CheY-like chemotaxis protein